MLEGLGLLAGSRSYAAKAASYTRSSAAVRSMGLKMPDIRRVSYVFEVATGFVWNLTVTYAPESGKASRSGRTGNASTSLTLLFEGCLTRVRSASCAAAASKLRSIRLLIQAGVPLSG